MSQSVDKLKELLFKPESEAIAYGERRGKNPQGRGPDIASHEQGRARNAEGDGHAKRQGPDKLGVFRRPSGQRP